jgi:hypothetical protein
MYVHCAQHIARKVCALLRGVISASVSCRGKPVAGLRRVSF